MPQAGTAYVEHTLWIKFDLTWVDGDIDTIGSICNAIWWETKIYLSYARDIDLAVLHFRPIRPPKCSSLDNKNKCMDYTFAS